ncbi:hypothetical protein GCM10010211_07560 [Streptomyces albospinus]|uniref:Uncharacterized protein n=1 Tax=Streptomyces albospinus TaxID=285515 RepID=A0ABQ2URT2_9ACTN|nr:hypothetical protein [Streptomyces albospinus]GGU46516.1 hypothetical protein GCM10010211_07560 [Streptomyces albospinus]
MTSPDFLPSHVVPPGGLATWAAPDATRPLVPLDPLLPVQVVERRGDWALALCSNGWSAWVDGRLLLSVPHGPPAAGQPAARTADPRPLLGTAEDALGRYRQLVDELLAGQLDGESFGARTRGTRVGVVVDGDAVWLYDARHERWCYCDGAALQTFAVAREPSADAGEAGEAGNAGSSVGADAGRGTGAASGPGYASGPAPSRVHAWPERPPAPPPQRPDAGSGGSAEPGGPPPAPPRQPGDFR